MITVYSKPNCPQCDVIKKWLSVNSFEYSEIIFDIGQPHEDNKTYIPVKEFKALYPHVQSAPQVVIDGELIGGVSATKDHLSLTS